VLFRLNGWAFGEDVLRGALHRSRPARATGKRTKDIDRYVGGYASAGFTVRVKRIDDQLVMTNPLNGEDTALHHQRDDDFWVDLGPLKSEVVFLNNERGRPQRVHLALRTLRRVC